MIRDKIETERYTLYLADAVKLLPTLHGIDSVVTDPPYGIGRDGRKFSTSSHGGHKGYEFRGWDHAPPDAKAFELMFAIASEHVIWGGNYFCEFLPPRMGWLVWDKGQDISASDCELAYTHRNEALRRIVLNRVSLMQDGTSHPTQKPVALMKWCIGFVKGEAILDPYMGSGTTGVACMKLGRKFIGVEIDPTYFAIAAKRIATAAEEPPLFKSAREAEQAELFAMKE